jgi:hypothetical protein
MDGASWALTHIKGIIDIKGVLFWVLHFFSFFFKYKGDIGFKDYKDVREYW